MDREQLRSRVRLSIKSFVQQVATHYNIDYNQLMKDLDDPAQGKMTCMHRMKSGKNKGKLCPKAALENGFCGRHQSSASVTLGNVVSQAVGAKLTAKAKKAKAPTATQLKEIAMLNAVVSKQETKLVKRKDGKYFHEDSEFIFSEDSDYPGMYIVIGRLDGEAIVKLTRMEVEKCERHCWPYDEEQVEDSEDNSDSESE